MAPDFVFRDHGSVATVHPQNEAAWDWFNDHVEYEGWAMIGDGVAVEPRLVDNLAEGMMAEGFVVAIKRSEKGA